MSESRRPTWDLTQSGWLILCAIVVLVVVGVASIFVTDTHYASGHDGPRNAAKQCIRILISAFGAIGILHIGYQRIARHAYPIFLVALLLLLPLLVAGRLETSFGGFTAPRKGAYRWLHFPGFPLQPSELMKLAYVLALAWYLRYRKNYRSFVGLLLPVVGSLIPLALILLEPDLGTALLMVPVLLSMLFMAGARKRHLMVIVIAGMGVVPIAWGQIKDYQRSRVTSVLLQSTALRRSVIAHPENYQLFGKNPEAVKRSAIEWSAGSGYQLVHSLNAIGSGGFLGQGWGEGVYVSRAILPDRHNDFVFSVIGHQWGLSGTLLVLVCFTIITLAGCHIASATTDPLGRLLAVGLMTLIACQVLINVGMAVGLLPITGMTLPFVSYGGSSLLTNFGAVALLISIAQHRPYLLETRPFEYGAKTRTVVPITHLDRAD